MSIGSRIRYIRLKRGLTQKELGIMLGFKESTAEVRIAQYETDDRVPRRDLLNLIAEKLNVEIDAIAPNLDHNSGILHSLFALEDEVSLRVKIENGKPVLYFDELDQSYQSILLREAVRRWALQAERCKNGEITKEEYDDWRLSFIEIYGEDLIEL